MKNRFEAVIVGMGPAGLAAAVELGRLGVQVAVVDDQPNPGGQVYRQPSPDFSISDTRFLGVKYQKGQRLIDEFNSVRDRCTVYNEANIWGFFNGDSLSLARNNEIFLIGFKKLILAEGAMERSWPFPGWTLPGVMTLGGLHKLVLPERTLPGRRFLLAGCSPLLLPVAASIVAAGGEIAAICDPVPFYRYLKILPEFLRQRELAHEFLTYLFPVIKELVTVLRPYTVISASGHDRVEEARVARLDPQGRPVPGSEKQFKIDILGVSDGFLPLGRLARLCGCEHIYDPLLHYWKPQTDDQMRSSRPDIYIAGDSKGMGGRDLAMVEGRLAALHLAGELGRISASELNGRKKRLQTERTRLQQYAAKLNEVFSLPSGPPDIMDKETIVCRCEHITVGDVEAGIERGYRNINEMKRTRLGMGLCQGRTCESIAARIMLRKGIPIEEIGYLNLRPPLTPLPFFLLEEYAQSHRGADQA
ncbi:MAG: NAD(P)/FAD-dependent oxidoreductase [Thermodesulfobacteriota bacterium]